ncbi:MAG: hypothetical protein EX285_06200 [Thaumarchaeota archaeon]|nr:hypothetical protein [Nitrososphaerota archaeon]
MPQYGVQDIIKFAGTGKPAKFGDAFGQMMQGKVSAGVEAIRQKVAAKLGGLDPTGERGDGVEEVDVEDIELTADEIEALEADEPEEGSGEETDEDSDTDT